MTCQVCAGSGYILHYNAKTDAETRVPCTWCQAPKREQEPAVRSEGNVRILPVVTHHDLPPDRILIAAQEAKLKRCIVIGEEQDGSFWFAATFADGPEVLWALERAKMELMNAGVATL